ncbi:MAG: transcriptional regulator of sugar metabolism [Conexibacter sp.]|nr:transcriptional regulator of sugar metabolism [Conexibacter sp.]
MGPRSDGPLVLKGERQRRILELLGADGRVVAAELQERLGVSGYTIRRDLDELAAGERLQRIHGGALARSPVAPTYAGRQTQAREGKTATARAAATLLEPGQVVVLDGGSTALALVAAIPPGHSGTFVTHSPPVAAALGAHPGLDVVVIGGTLDRRAMVAVGAETIHAYERIAADVCFLGTWSLNATTGVSSAYYEEAQVRRVLLDCAGRTVALASREKLATVSAFGSGPATALTHIATEPGVPDDVLAPFRELGIHVVTVE